jgi:hypothetical protein
VKFLHNPLTDRKFKSANKFERPYTYVLVYSCFTTTATLFSVSSMSNVYLYKCTKPLLAAKISLRLP